MFLNCSWCSSRETGLTCGLCVRPCGPAFMFEHFCDLMRMGCSLKRFVSSAISHRHSHLVHLLTSSPPTPSACQDNLPASTSPERPYEQQPHDSQGSTYNPSPTQGHIFRSSTFKVALFNVDSSGPTGPPIEAQRTWRLQWALCRPQKPRIKIHRT